MEQGPSLNLSSGPQNRLSGSSDSELELPSLHQIFTDVDAIIGALATPGRMSSLVRYPEMWDALTALDRIQMMVDSFDSANRFINTLTSVKNPQVYEALCRWMASGSGKMKHLLRTDSLYVRKLNILEPSPSPGPSSSSLEFSHPSRPPLSSSSAKDRLASLLDNRDENIPADVFEYLMSDTSGTFAVWDPTYCEGEEFPVPDLSATSRVERSETQQLISRSTTNCVISFLRSCRLFDQSHVILSPLASSSIDWKVANCCFNHLQILSKAENVSLDSEAKLPISRNAWRFSPDQHLEFVFPKTESKAASAANTIRGGASTLFATSRGEFEKYRKQVFAATAQISEAIGEFCFGPAYPGWFMVGEIVVATDFQNLVAVPDTSLHSNHGTGDSQPAAFDRTAEDLKALPHTCAISILRVTDGGRPPLRLRGGASKGSKTSGTVLPKASTTRFTDVDPLRRLVRIILRTNPGARQAIVSDSDIGVLTRALGLDGVIPYYSADLDDVHLQNALNSPNVGVEVNDGVAIICERSATLQIPSLDQAIIQDRSKGQATPTTQSGALPVNRKKAEEIKPSSLSPGTRRFRRNIDINDLGELKDALCDYRLELAAALKGKIAVNVLSRIKNERKPFEALDTLFNQMGDRPRLQQAFFAFMESKEELRVFLKKPGMSILSLDGGAFNGYATLLMLEQLLDPALTEGGEIPKPCEVFDLICGTSTGGLIAIMLGRLKMTLEEAKEAFLKLAPEMFGDDRKVMGVLLEGSKFDAEKANTALEALIKSKTGDENALFADSDCDVFVTTIDTQNAATPRPLLVTSYEPPNEAAQTQVPPDHKWTCVEAARATLAASTYFDPFTIGQYTFQDAAGSSVTNPAEIVFEEKEAMEKYHDLPIKLFVSLGTGLETLSLDASSTSETEQVTVDAALAWVKKKGERFPDIKVDDERSLATAKYLVSVATNASAVASSTEERFGKTGVYWRFQPSQDLDDLDVFDYQNPSKTAAIVDKYFMGQARTSARACSGAIVSMKEVKTERDQAAKG